MPYVTRAQIIDAISRSVMVERADGIDANVEGTFALIPTWIGSERVWTAARIEETSGFEVAFESVADSDILYSAADFDRFGVWYDSETGEYDLDRTMHIRGTLSGVAHDVARIYSQKAIWSWHRHEVEYVDPTCTAL